MTQANQNVLFLVTGMTPAIITETIWALACDPQLDEADRWIPDRVEVLSTEHGLTQIRSRLLDNGALERLKKDFPQVANIKFDSSCMHSIREANTGEPLLDLRTPEHNEYAANQINERIRELTQEENTTLHVSIAGGRKTMGFYAGYALSLHGRAQDRMSHVLVDERFENIQDFYYPTPYTHHVTDFKQIAWDASKAQVWLAEIPFVRMKSAIQEKHQLRSEDSFSEVVNKIENSFSPTSLVIDLDKNTATFNSKTITLPPREFAYLHWFADLRMQGKPGITRPRIKNTDKVRAIDEKTGKLTKDGEEQNYISELTKQFSVYYSEQKASIGLTSTDKSFFETTNTLLRDQLIDKLGMETAAKFTIHNNKKPGTPFFLDIPADSITIIDTMK